MRKPIAALPAAAIIAAVAVVALQTGASASEARPSLFLAARPARPRPPTVQIQSCRSLPA
jgi:hypothetical protein